MKVYNEIIIIIQSFIGNDMSMLQLYLYCIKMVASGMFKFHSGDQLSPKHKNIAMQIKCFTDTFYKSKSLLHATIILTSIMPELESSYFSGCHLMHCNTLEH